MAPIRHSRGHLGAGAAVLVCILLSWFILLIGIAACQKQVLVKHALEFEWWIICFEFLLVLLAATHLTGYHTGHAGVVALKAINTVLCMIYANLYNQLYRRGATGVSGTVVTSTALDGVSEKRIKTALAGFVLLSISNMLLLAVLGTAPTATNTYNNKEVTSARGTQMTHTQPASAYGTTAAAPANAGMGVGQNGVAGAGQTVV